MVEHRNNWPRDKKVGIIFCIVYFLFINQEAPASRCSCYDPFTNGGAGEVSSEPDITKPGPDTPSFPTSPFTLPKGRSYIENFPLYVGLPNNHHVASYQWPFLFRRGLIDCFEFRLMGSGFTTVAHSCGHDRIIGLSPLDIGFKAHIWGSHDMLWVPSVGVEMYLVTPIASRVLREGIQFIVNSLFNCTFSETCNLECNLCLFSSRLPIKRHAIFGLVEWALQKEIMERLEIFFEGAYTTPKSPFYEKKLLLGFGFQHAINKRISIYGSYIWSLFKSDQDNINLGFAVAF